MSLTKENLDGKGYVMRKEMDNTAEDATKRVEITKELQNTTPQVNQIIPGPTTTQESNYPATASSSFPGLSIPDSPLAKEATQLLREHSTDLLFNHSMRVYLVAAQQGHQLKRHFDPELLYIAAVFHDFGLLKKFSSPDDRFEVDSANVARQFLKKHGIPEEKIRVVWEAIALHTTPGITQYMDPEVALLYSGVGLDVLGKGFDEFPTELRENIVAEYPRDDFKTRFVQEYFAGFAHKPSTTYGTVNSSFCERLLPGYKVPNGVDLIAGSPFPDPEPSSTKELGSSKSESQA